MVQKMGRTDDDVSENEEVADNPCGSGESVVESVSDSLSIENGSKSGNEENTLPCEKSPGRIDEDPETEKRTAPEEKCVADIGSLEEKKTGKESETIEENLSSETGRRSTRLRAKKPKLTQVITTSDEDNLESDNGDEDFIEEIEEKPRTPRKRGRPPKRKTPLRRTSSRSEDESDSRGPEKPSPKETKPKKVVEAASKVPREFSSGAFVVLKTDFHASTSPPIWRIDGKALLQKYIHFEQTGQILYKNTSTYSGWTMNNKDDYYPAPIEIVSQNRKETIVHFKREEIIDDDSD